MLQNDVLVKKLLSADDIPSLQKAGLHAELVAYINELILHNFDELIYLLYRVDVREQKLKSLLKENSQTDAAALIASLVIERQIEKIKSRQEYRRDKNNIDESESW